MVTSLRSRVAVLAAVLLAVLVTVSSGTAGAAAAATPEMAGPQLTFAHRIAATGGVQLWAIPLFGSSSLTPRLQPALQGGGWSWDRSLPLTGHFGALTPGDPDATRVVFWHAAADGSVRVWAVGGGADTAPRWLTDLRASWSWQNSRPMVADLDGNGWDDLLVVHRANCSSGGWCDANVWGLFSDGQRLGAPRLLKSGHPWTGVRYTVGDFDHHVGDDLMTTQVVYGENGPNLGYRVDLVDTDGTTWALNGVDQAFTGPAAAGWSYAGSRQLVGDVTGDGWDDIVTIHALTNAPGFLVWVHANCTAVVGNPLCFAPPVLWQDLRGAPWSGPGSRQFLADTDGDHRVDLVTLHRSGTDTGMLVWRSVSTGYRFQAPQQLAHLPGRAGWNFGLSREGVSEPFWY